MVSKLNNDKEYCKFNSKSMRKSKYYALIEEVKHVEVNTKVGSVIDFCRDIAELMLTESTNLFFLLLVLKVINIFFYNDLFKFFHDAFIYIYAS